MHDLLYSPTGGRDLCAGGFNPFGNLTPSQECIDFISRRTLNTNELKQRTVEANMQGSLFKGWAGDIRFALGADYRYNSYTFAGFGLPPCPMGRATSWATACCWLLRARSAPRKSTASCWCRC